MHHSLELGSASRPRQSVTSVPSQRRVVPTPRCVPLSCAQNQHNSPTHPSPLILLKMTLATPPNSPRDIEDLCDLCVPFPSGTQVASAGGETVFPMKAVKKKAREENVAVCCVEWRVEKSEEMEPRFLVIKRPEKGWSFHSFLEVYYLEWEADLGRHNKASLQAYMSSPQSLFPPQPSQTPPQRLLSLSPSSRPSLALPSISLLLLPPPHQKNSSPRRTASLPPFPTSSPTSP